MINNSYFVTKNKCIMGLQGLKENVAKTDFIPVEYADVRQTKAAFKKLMRACVPSSPNQEPEHTFHK